MFISSGSGILEFAIMFLRLTLFSSNSVILIVWNTFLHSSIFPFQDTKLVSALDVYEDDNPELLLTYNRMYPSVTTESACL